MNISDISLFTNANLNNISIICDSNATALNASLYNITSEINITQICLDHITGHVVEKEKTPSPTRKMNNIYRHPYVDSVDRTTAFYGTYDPNIGIRIAGVLGSFLFSIIAYTLYKTRCKRDRWTNDDKQFIDRYSRVLADKWSGKMPKVINKPGGKTKPSIDETAKWICSQPLQEVSLLSKWTIQDTMYNICLESFKATACPVTDLSSSHTNVYQSNNQLNETDKTIADCINKTSSNSTTASQNIIPNGLTVQSTHSDNTIHAFQPVIKNKNPSLAGKMQNNTIYNSIKSLENKGKLLNRNCNSELETSLMLRGLETVNDELDSVNSLLSPAASAEEMCQDILSPVTIESNIDLLSPTRQELGIDILSPIPPECHSYLSHDFSPKIKQITEFQDLLSDPSSIQIENCSQKGNSDRNVIVHALPDGGITSVAKDNNQANNNCVPSLNFKTVDKCTEFDQPNNNVTVRQEHSDNIENNQGMINNTEQYCKDMQGLKLEGNIDEENTENIQSILQYLPDNTCETLLGKSDKQSNTDVIIAMTDADNLIKTDLNENSCSEC